MASKFDRSAYNNWQNREAGRQERIETSHDFWSKDLESPPPARRDLSVNQTSRRRPAGLNPGDLSTSQSGRRYSGAACDFIVFDELHEYMTIKGETPKPAQVHIETPTTARAERVAKGDFTIDREELFATYEKQGQKLTGAVKRKIYAAEQARMEEARVAWQAERDREELDELAVNIAQEVTLSELGYGAW